MPSVFAARDLRALCRTGAYVTFGGSSTYPDGEAVMGLYDRPSQFKFMDEGIGGVETAMPTLRLPFNAFNSMPTANDVVTVDGCDYKVSPPTAEDDGAFLCYDLHLAGDGDSE